MRRGIRRSYLLNLFKEGTAFMQAHPTLKEHHRKFSRWILSHISYSFDEVRQKYTNDDLKVTAARSYLMGACCGIVSLLFALSSGAAILLLMGAFIALIAYGIGVYHTEVLSLPQSPELEQKETEEREKTKQREKRLPSFKSQVIMFIVLGGWAYTALNYPNTIRSIVEDRNLVHYLPQSWQEYFRGIIADDQLLLTNGFIILAVLLEVIRRIFLLCAWVKKRYPQKEIREL